MTIGLDVGSGLVKAAVVDHSGGTPELCHVVLTPLAGTAIVEGEVMDPGLVVDAIRSTMDATATRTAAVTAAVGGRDVIVKRISVERVKPAQARELMRWEAEQHVPFDIEACELDFQVLDPDAEGLEMQVLLVAAKRELVDGRRRLLEDGGAPPSIMDVDAFALHNAFVASHPEGATGTVVLLDIGHESTTLNVVEDGIPALTRDMAIGTRRLREELQRHEELDTAAADAVLRGRRSSAVLERVVQRHGEALAAGVERAVALLASASRGFDPLRAVYVAGGGARVPGLVPWLADRLQVPTHVANPLAQLAIRPGALDGLAADEVAPLLLLPVGLALREAA